MAILAPVPKFRAFNAVGNPLAGGKLYTYAANSSTPLATYTDAGAGTPNTNPVLLDANGEANVWLGAADYKFVLKDASDVLQYTVDYVNAAIFNSLSVTTGTIGTLASTTANIATGNIKNLNGIRFADRFVGVDAGAKIAAAIADLPSTGGIVDASQLAGDPVPWSVDPFADAGDKPVELRLGDGTYTTNVAIAVNGYTNINGHQKIVGRGYQTRILAGPSFPVSTPVVTVGQGDGTTFHGSVGGRLESLTVDANNVAGSIGVKANGAMENSGLFNVGVVNAKVKGIWITCGAGGGQNIGVEHLWVINSDAAGSIGIHIDNTNDGGRIWVHDATIVGATGKALAAGILDEAPSPTYFSNIHVEHATDGVKINGASSAAHLYSISGASGGSVTNVVHITNAGKYWVGSGIESFGAIAVLDDLTTESFNNWVNFRLGPEYRGKFATTEGYRVRDAAGTGFVDAITRSASNAIGIGGASGMFVSGDLNLYPANGEQWKYRWASEEITIAAAANTDSTADLLPANSIIEAVVARVTTVIPTAATFTIGDPTTAARFATGVAVAAGTTAVGLIHSDQTGAGGPKQVAAAKVRITPNLSPAAATGKVRITVFYRTFIAPVS
jgi:hypothetical protein